MKINTKQALKEVNGSPIKTENGELTIGNVLANVMFFDEGIGKLKGYTLGIKFSQEDEVDVDEADLQAIKKALETTKVYSNNLLVGQALSMLNK